MLTAPSGHFVEYLLTHKDVREPWQEHVEHDFVKKLADGTLPLDSFKYYLIQDYLYLVGSTLFPLSSATQI